VYRGHTAAVTCAKFLPLGTYVASGDARGRLRIWSYDHDEHLPRLDVQVLAGPRGGAGRHVRGRRGAVGRIVQGRDVGHGGQVAVYFHSGPPFKRVAWGEDSIAAPAKRYHARGAVHHLRYSEDGSTLASLGTDGSVCFYDGATMELRRRVANAHSSSSVYSCSWDRSGLRLLMYGADGCA
jgi:WD40 repeat protein